MITIAHLSKNYGRKILFADISLNINRDDKIGLIGPNGSGKSTLFSLILGETEASAGEIRVNKDTHIGYLPQEASFLSSNTVLSELTEGDARIKSLLREKEELEEKNAAGSLSYGEVLHNLDALGYFELEHKSKKILMGLGFKERDFSRCVANLSGGWQIRVLLAKLLTYRYELLLLDEPTNYLDLNAALWLKDYLANFKGTFIMISHDKVFLTDVTNYTLILENGSITKVQGNYQHYEQIKEEKRKFLLKQFKEQEKKRKQLERFVERFHAQPNKAASVRAKRRVLERMDKEKIVVPEEPGASIGKFHFPPAMSSGYRVISLEGISKSYGDIQVYKDLDFEITKGEKAVLAGENGAGKSTLLKILADVVDIDSGKRTVWYNVEVGYFSQTRTDVLNLENTVLEEAYSAAPGYMAEETIRTILGAFLFTGEDADKKVKVLSGGEKSRLILAKLLINPPNLLLLDEPTTHLDVDAVEALVEALKDYEGTIVFISHDIYFVRSLANAVFEVKNGKIRKFPGNFDYYLEKKDQIETFIPLEKTIDCNRKYTNSHVIKERSSLTGFIEERKPKINIQKVAIDLAKQKAREAEKKREEEEKKRKIHNGALRDKINKLEDKKGRLRLESYAKARALSNPHIYRDEDTARDYGRRIKEIEKLISGLNNEIKELEREII